MKLLKKSLIILSTVTALALSGCGGNSTTVTGVLADGAIGNASYECGTTTGFTNVKGEFTCPVGSSVSFFYGNIKLGGVSKLPSDNIVLIQDVLHVNREKVNDESVTRMAVFLQSLDKNSNHDDGIFLDPSYIADSVTTVVDFTQFDDKKVTELIKKAKKTEVTKEVARTNLYEVTQNVKLYKSIDGKSKPKVTTPSSSGGTSSSGSSTPSCGYTLNGIYFNGSKISSSNSLGLGSANSLTLNFSTNVNTAGLTVTSTDGNVTLGTITKSGDNNISFDYTASTDMMSGRTSDLNIADTLSIKQALCSNTADVNLFKKYYGPLSRAELDTLITNYTNAYNTNTTATDTLTYAQDIIDINTTNVTDMSRLFLSKSSFNLDISKWNTSNVTDMNQMFYGVTAFNQNIGDWNTSKVTDMSYMFNNASTFDQNIGSWDTSKVENMQNMFAGASAFNKALNFNTSNVTNMSTMFYGAASFNQALAFDTSNVTNMFNMFSGATNFNKALNFNTTKVTNMNYMFKDATAFNQDLSAWDVTISDDARTSEISHIYFSSNWGGGTEPSWTIAPISLADLKTLITAYTSNNSGSDGKGTYASQIIKANTSTILDMSELFKYKGSFNLDISKWDTSSVTNMSSMFWSATSFNQPLDWNTSKVEDMAYMFRGATNFNQSLPFDTSMVTTFNNMFYQASKFNQPLPWDTSKVINMHSVFSDATDFNQPLDWNTSNTEYMANTFNGATSFNQDLSGWNVTKVSNHYNFDKDATAWTASKPSW